MGTAMTHWDGHRGHFGTRILRLLIAVALICALAAVRPAAATADDYADPRRKVALVIGVSRYQHSLPLDNTVADMRHVSERIKAAGFELKQIVDPSLAALRDGIAAFLLSARGADVALVYYAGHAVQIDGLNYLLPVEFDGDKKDILGQLVGVDEMLKGMASAAKAQVLLLDACRDNPFLDRIDRTLGRHATDKGLATILMPVVDPAAAAAQPGEGVRGLIVGYATQPFDTALDGDKANGPYAMALHDALHQADEDLNTILVKAARTVLTETKGVQRPEHRVALTGPLYLVSRKRPLDCDILAAEEDNNISVKGVAFDNLDIAAAEKACRADLQRFPDNPRLKHNLARVLDKAGRDQEAVELYRQAAADGYDWAQNNLAVMLMNGEGTDVDMVEAIAWLKRAYAQGNRQAVVNFTEYDVSDLFREIPRIAVVLQRALRKAAPARPALASGRLDEATLAAVDETKRQAGIRSQGITLELLDRLGIVAEVFNRVAAR